MTRTWFDIYTELVQLEGYNCPIDIDIEWKHCVWLFSIKLAGEKSSIRIDPDTLNQSIPQIKESVLSSLVSLVSSQSVSTFEDKSDYIQLDKYANLGKTLQEIPDEPICLENPWWWEIHEAISAHPKTEAFEAWRLTFKPEHRYISKKGWPEYNTCWCFWFEGGGRLDFVGHHPSIEAALESAIKEVIKETYDFLEFAKAKNNKNQINDATTFLVFMNDKLALFNYLRNRHN